MILGISIFLGIVNIHQTMHMSYKLHEALISSLVHKLQVLSKYKSLFFNFYLDYNKTQAENKAKNHK